MVNYKIFLVSFLFFHLFFSFEEDIVCKECGKVFWKCQLEKCNCLFNYACCQRLDSIECFRESKYFMNLTCIYEKCDFCYIFQIPK